MKRGKGPCGYVRAVKAVENLTLRAKDRAELRAQLKASDSMKS